MRLHLHYDVIAKAVEARDICFFAGVNRKVVYIAVLRIDVSGDVTGV